MSDQNANTTPPASSECCLEKKVLIVDDDTEMAAKLEKTLTKAGYVCKTAFSGRECLGLLEKNDYGLVIAEILVPDIDGYDICRYMRSNHRFFATPLVFLTIMKDKNEMLRSYTLGVDMFIQKPIKSQEFLNLIKACQVRSRKNLDIHPVSSLPGSNVMKNRLGILIDEGELFSCISVNVRKMADYNHEHGYARGDELLKQVAQTLCGTVHSNTSKLNFISQTEGSCFIISTATENETKLLENIKKAMKKLGVKISISCVNNEFDQFESTLELLDKIKASKNRIA